MLSSKTNLKYFLKCAKNKCVCFQEIIRLIITEMRVKMKKRSHRYDIKRTRPRHGYEYTTLQNVSQYDDRYSQ